MSALLPDTPIMTYGQIRETRHKIDKIEGITAEMTCLAM